MGRYVYVKNCFHWIGYHLVTALLDEEWTVYAKDPLNTPEREHLSMFLARHSQFSLLEDEVDKDKIPLIEIRENKDENKVKIHLTTKQGKKVYIDCSSLVGEWMPMSSTQVLYKCKVQPWEGLKKEEIIEIGVFAGIIIKCLKAAEIPQEICLVSRFSKKASEQNPNIVVSIDSPSTEDILCSLQEHRSRFNYMYPDIIED